MAKCDKCKHSGICKNEENMKKYEAEIREKSKLLEYQTFHADIRCDNYFDDKHTLNFREIGGV